MITLSEVFRVLGVATDVTSFKVHVSRDDTSADVVGTSGVPLDMTKVATGIYQKSFTEPAYNLTYTATYTVVYVGQTIVYSSTVTGTTTPGATTPLTCEYQTLVNDVALASFGLRASSTDVITEAVASSDQAADILRAIAKGLSHVYSAHRWSFLRPVCSFTTYAPYTTGTITVDVSGNVTGVGTTFPSYSASAGGWLTIPSVGSYAIATYGGATTLTLTGYDGAAITTGTTYTIYFDSYPMPSGVDTLEGRLTYPHGYNQPSDPLTKVSEVQVRAMLSRSDTPSRPRFYAETTKTFDPTRGSQRSITLWPTPDDSYALSAVGVLRTVMVDSTNKYPAGADVLGEVIATACLAMAERDIDGKDETSADAVQHRALQKALALAISQDRDRASPETLGVDRGDEDYPDSAVAHQQRSGRIYWQGGGISDGWI